MKKNILYIESGQFGGGSFNALNLMIQNMENISPVVIYFNNNKFIKNQKIKSYLIKDAVYSLNTNFIKRKIINRFNLIISKFFPSFSIKFEKLIHKNTINEIIQIINKHNINIIHTNVSVSRDFFITFCLNNKIKLVGHLRTPKYDLLNSYKSRIINLKYDKIIAASKSIKDLWASKGIECKKIQTIYDGVKIKSYNLKNINDLTDIKIKENSFIIGCVSRFAKGKGQEDLLYDFYEILKINKFKDDYLLFFFGDGELEQKCKDIVKKLEISKHVIFFGYINDALAYLNNLDLLVLPSSIDVCSNSILEAFLAKVPVVCLKAGGNPELIADGVNGFTYIHQSELINKINLIRKNKYLAKEFSEKSYDLLKKKFNVENNSFKIFKVYNS